MLMSNSGTRMRQFTDDNIYRARPVVNCDLRTVIEVELYDNCGLVELNRDDLEVMLEVLNKYIEETN